MDAVVGHTVGVVLPALSPPPMAQLLGASLPSGQRLAPGKSSSVGLCGGAHVAGKHGYYAFSIPTQFFVCVFTDISNEFDQLV
jgi:hypothetical protein